MADGQRALHAVGKVFVPHVQRFTCDGGEHVGDEVAPGLCDIGVEILERDRDVLHVTAKCGRQLDRHIGKGHQARAGHFVKLPLMPRFGQRCDNHICDVVNVDDGLRHIAAGHGQHTRQYRIAQVAFGEVLRKPCGADDCERGAGVADHLFAQPCVMFAASGQEDQMLDARCNSRFTQRLELFHGTGEREIGEVGDIGGADTGQCGGPCFRRFPIEGRGGIARSATDRVAQCFKLGGDAGTGLSGGADDEDGLVLHGSVSLVGYDDQGDSVADGLRS